MSKPQGFRPTSSPPDRRIAIAPRDDHVWQAAALSSSPEAGQMWTSAAHMIGLAAIFERGPHRNRTKFRKVIARWQTDPYLLPSWARKFKRRPRSTACRMELGRMTYAIKAEVVDPLAKLFEFTAQKSMYGGKQVAKGDTVYVFASENEGGRGLVARGIVTATRAVAGKRGVARQTPRVSLTIKRTALARQPLGRKDLKSFCDWADGRPETELNFKFYRQATNKLAGISDETAAFLNKFF